MRDEPRRAAGSLQQVSVLVVDDEAVYRDTLCKVLGRRGFRVGAAASGEEALRLVAQRCWDVMVLDLKMPGLDGMATLELVRRTSSATEVILLTGHGSVDAGIQAMRAQAFDFLLKPTSVDQLVGVIEGAAAKHRSLSEPRRP
jgi:DNA-binding NtrC family response regulator